MRPPLNEIEKLKFYMSSAFAVIRAMIIGVAILIVQPLWADIILGTYLLYTLAYAAVRISLVVSQDSEYLKIPKIDPDLVPRKDGR